MASAAVDKINGLTLIPDWLSERDATTLITEIDSNPWRDDLRRRVQHYGYIYDYRARQVTHDMRIGALPDWLMPLAKTITRDLNLPTIFDQVIINEYQPGQGISAHIDCRPCFGETVASLSLGSAVDMYFSKPQDQVRHTLRLEPQSLLILQGDARHVWKHAIPPRKSDVVNGVRIGRTRRLSLTFRTVRAQSS